LKREGVKKIPLTLSSPSRGEEKHNEIEKEVPSPPRGEGRVGVI
jgi:hypothetical protein